MEHIKNINNFLTYIMITIFSIMGIWKCTELTANNAYEQATEQAQYMLIFKNAKELNRAAKALYPTTKTDTITAKIKLDDNRNN